MAKPDDDDGLGGGLKQFKQLNLKIADLERRIAELRKTSSQHEDQLARLDQGAGKLPPRAFTILCGTGEEAATYQEVVDAWLDLGAWVTWYIRTNELEDLWLPCWWRHEGVVQEVAAFRWWHHALVGSRDAPHQFTMWGYAIRSYRATVLDKISKDTCDDGHTDENERRETGHAHSVECYRGLAEHAHNAGTAEGRKSAPRDLSTRWMREVESELKERP